MSDKRPPLILASASPRRRRFLEELGLTFECVPAHIDESVYPGEAPRGYVERLAREKAAATSQRRRGAAVLAADTTVVLDGTVLGKPADPSDARRMLNELSGKTHRVLTGIAVATPWAEPVTRVVETEVDVRTLSPTEIAWYVRSGEPMDKAGAYAIQGLAGAFVKAIRGSYSNVVGLPLAETLELLAGAGVSLPWQAE